MSVRRFDIGDLRRPVRLDNGYLRVDAYLTRAGVFSYRKADGTELKEYRPPEEVFAADSLASFELMPVTNDHPSVGLLTPENTHQFQVGTVGSPAREEAKMRGALLVTDSKAIKALEKGKTQVSLGYVCDLDFTPGVTPDGEHYDAVQRNIRGNHAALVAVGRAGPEIRVRMDTTDAAMLPSENRTDDLSEIQTPSAEPQVTKRKIKFDNASTEVEVDEPVAALFDQANARADAAAKASKVELDKTSARADAAEAKIKDLEKQLADAPAKALALAKSRAELESKARAHLGEKFKLDTLDDNAVRTAVVEKLSGEKFDGKSPAYVEARFDAELAIAARTNTGLAAVRAASASHTDAADPMAKAKAEYDAALAGANK